MRMSEMLNNNPAIVTLGAIAVLAIALVVLAFQMQGPAPLQYDAYYWDLDTGEVFTANSRGLPPITTASGGQGALAYLYSCGSCTPDEWFGYLETYSDEYHRVRNENGFKGMSPMEQQQFTADNRLIRATDGGEWVPYDSSQGQSIREAVESRCTSPDQLTRCNPG